MPQPTYVNPYQTLASQYSQEQEDAEQQFVKQWGFTPSPAQLMTFIDGDEGELKSLILRGLRAINANPSFIYAVEELGMLITPKNKDLVAPETLEAWDAAIDKFESDDERTEGSS